VIGRRDGDAPDEFCRIKCRFGFLIPDGEGIRAVDVIAAGHGAERQTAVEDGRPGRHLGDHCGRSGHIDAAVAQGRPIRQFRALLRVDRGNELVIADRDAALRPKLWNLEECESDKHAEEGDATQPAHEDLV
jgi:hypothetical protein